MPKPIQKPETVYEKVKRHIAGSIGAVPHEQPKPPKSQLEYIGGHFAEFQKNGQGWKAICPLHDDSKPSLSINEGDNGGVLVRCLAGCRTADLLDVAGLRMADLMPGAVRRPKIVAIYDYKDEHGELLYQALRFEPKDFRCRRPDGNGGWIWKNVFEGVDKVPYRLSDLLAANKTEMVFIVEGEKDADRLASLGLVSTTNIGGAGKWRDEYNVHFAGRPVVALPDNDAPGRDHAASVVRSMNDLAASVRIVELPGVPEKGDVSDWLDAGGSKQKLLALVEGTPNETTRHRDYATSDPLGSNQTGQRSTQRDEPLSRCPDVPLKQRIESFPVEVFPRILQGFISSIAEALPCPPDFPGSMVLAVLGACIGRKRCIEIKPGWIEFAVLWIVCVARSGDRKTPAFDKVTNPLREKQRRLLASYLEEKREFESLPAKEQKDYPWPRLVQVLTTDATIEALKDVLAGNPNGIIFPADELSGWVRAMSQYKGGRGDDRQHWLSIWSGVQIVCNRKGAEPIIVNDPFVCVTGGIQPDALPDLIDDGREDGFAARLLFTYPHPIPNKDWNEDAVRDDTQYAGVCESLWTLEPSRKPVAFSDHAKALWIEWVNAHRRESPSDNLRAMWSKCEGHCARLALVLFLSRKACNETKAALIDVESIRGAVKLIAYFKSHARRVYGSVANTTDNSRIGNALRWIKKHGGVVTARKARMHGLCKGPDAAKELFEDLAELGHGTVTEESRGSVVFRINETTTQRDNDSQGDE